MDSAAMILQYAAGTCSLGELALHIKRNVWKPMQYIVLTRAGVLSHDSACKVLRAIEAS